MIRIQAFTLEAQPYLLRRLGLLVKLESRPIIHFSLNNKIILVIQHHFKDDICTLSVNILSRKFSELLPASSST